jgi:hypothetical protein
VARPCYFIRAPEGIVPYLALDSYRCHMMKSVVNAIQDLGVEVEHIPGGCTGLCQPLDVGVNKPLKKLVREQWEDWMLEEGLGTDGRSIQPTRELVVHWTIDAWMNLKNTTTYNAWRKEGFSWFD